MHSFCEWDKHANQIVFQIVERAKKRNDNAGMIAALSSHLLICHNRHLFTNFIFFSFVRSVDPFDSVIYSLSLQPGRVA